jgi:hypothetical protein
MYYGKNKDGNRNSYERLNCIQASFSELLKNDMEIKSANSSDLFKRLDEIDGELQDFHISAYQCDLLYKEQDSLKAELRQRGYKIN